MKYIQILTFLFASLVFSQVEHYPSLKGVKSIPKNCKDTIRINECYDGFFLLPENKKLKVYTDKGKRLANSEELREYMASFQNEEVLSKMLVFVNSKEEITTLVYDFSDNPPEQEYNACFEYFYNYDNTFRDEKNKYISKGYCFPSTFSDKKLKYIDRFNKEEFSFKNGQLYWKDKKEPIIVLESYNKDISNNSNRIKKLWNSEFRTGVLFVNRKKEVKGLLFVKADRLLEVDYQHSYAFLPDSLYLLPKQKNIQYHLAMRKGKLYNGVNEVQVFAEEGKQFSKKQLKQWYKDLLFTDFKHFIPLIDQKYNLRSIVIAQKAVKNDEKSRFLVDYCLKEECVALEQGIPELQSLKLHKNDETQILEFKKGRFWLPNAEKPLTIYGHGDKQKPLGGNKLKKFKDTTRFKGLYFENSEGEVVAVRFLELVKS